MPILWTYSHTFLLYVFVCENFDKVNYWWLSIKLNDLNIGKSNFAPNMFSLWDLLCCLVLLSLLKHLFKNTKKDTMLIKSD